MTFQKQYITLHYQPKPNTMKKLLSITLFATLLATKAAFAQFPQQDTLIVVGVPPDTTITIFYSNALTDSTDIILTNTGAVNLTFCMRALLGDACSAVGDLELIPSEQKDTTIDGLGGVSAGYYLSVTNNNAMLSGSATVLVERGDQPQPLACPSASSQWDLGGAPAPLNSIYNCLGGNVGIGTTSPFASLHIGGINKAIRVDYAGANYFGSLRWSGLQLGNNGDNRIIAGRTTTGGRLKFYVNNTNDASDYIVTPDGILAMTILETGYVGIGTISPNAKFEVRGTGAETIRISNNELHNSGWLSFETISGIRGIIGTSGTGNIFSSPTPGALCIRGYNGVEIGESSTMTMTVRLDGVGIFTTSPNYPLDVCGTIRATKVRVDALGCDFVFDPNYEKMPWQEKELYYKTHHRLPHGLDAAPIMENEGLDVGTNFIGLLQNVEEDRLDITELFKRMENLEKENDNLKREIEVLKKNSK